MKKKESLQKLNYIFLFLFINWHPIQLVLLKQEGIGIIIVGLALITLFANIYLRWSDFCKNFKPAPMAIWLILFIYSMINWIVKMPTYNNVSDVFTFIYDNFLSPFIFISIILIELRKDYDSILKLLLASFSFFVFVGLFNLQRVHGERLMTIGLYNNVPLNAFCAIFVSFEMIRKKILSTQLLFFMIVIFFTAIIIASTRKALGASMIVVAGYYLSTGNASDGKKLFNLIILIIFTGILMYAVKNSFMADRFVEENELYKNEKLFDDPVINNFFVNLTGDRIIQYQLALKLVPDHFFTGIGLMNFQEMTGFPVQLHTEYMVELCENGVIGFTLLLFMYIFLLNRCIRLYHLDKRQLFYIFGVASLLFINFTSWTYNKHFALCIITIIIYKTGKYEVKQLKTR